MENLQDSRKIGQGPPLLRTKSEASRGDPSGASSSGTAPRLILEANPTASADFNDKQPDHKLVIVPALDDPDQFDVRIADCASRVAKTSGLADRKGTLCFLQFMNHLEAELKIVLGDEYSFQPDWRKRWMQISRGSTTVQYKYAWLHNQYSQCNELDPFTDRWWVQVPTPLRIKYLRGNAGVPMDSDAWGFPLPSDFAETLLHFTFGEIPFEYHKVGDQSWHQLR